MNKFKVDDLVVLTGTSDVMRVLDYNVGTLIEDGKTALYPDTVHCAIGNDDSDDWFRADELGLVPDAITIGDTFMSPMEENIPDRTYEDINDDICKMFVQVSNYMQANLEGESIQLKIESGDVYGSDTALDISFSVRIGYNDPIVSSDLNQSARVALQRHTQNNGLKPLSIALYKGAA